jgi:hypothetical protein
MEANPGELQSIVVYQKVPKEVATVETVTALKKRHRDGNLAVGSRQRPKKRTQGNGGSRKKLAARRRTTRLAGMAYRKEHGRQGHRRTVLHQEPRRDERTRRDAEKDRNAKRERFNKAEGRSYV